MRRVCTGSLHVALPPERAAALFTPEGGTVWVALGDLRYARVTPGVQAGTVAVRLAPDGDGTRAEVTYDLTALSDDADLAAFAAGFDAMLAGWERDIAATR